MEGEATYDKVKTFVKSNIVPLLSNFNAEDAILMFDIKVNVFLFAGNSTNPLNTSQKYIIDKYRKVIDLEDHSRILEFFDLTATQLPAIRLIKIIGDSIKYKYDNENEISAVNLTHFVQKCLDNKIEHHYRSQKFPDDWNNIPVETLEFYARWCGICQRIEPGYNLLGTHFENHSDVFVAKIDATLNEITSIPIRSFPTILLFPKG
ncbi:hypothetical protein GJ496_010521 [Pomphorhynchus laevis]|nr:hypothetical protein GJ496_010521 [Pomphorhynchus laevis]